MISEKLVEIQKKIPANVCLVAVSKTKPVSDLLEAYDAGQRHFGENKVQEMTEKWEVLPKDIQWHLIGHLQTNKVKYIAPFVHLIHSVDSLKLLAEINKQGSKCQRVQRRAHAVTPPQQSLRDPALKGSDSFDRRIPRNPRSPL